jgi:phage terminase large subunit-like protein
VATEAPTGPLVSGGQHVADFLYAFCRHTKGRWAGRPLELEPWQREFVDEAFELDEHGRRIYTDVLLGVPRKNGKSTLASGCGLYLLVADGEAAPEVYAAAGSKDQARKVFDPAAMMVRKSPQLFDILRVQRSDIQAPFNDGIFQVIASDGDLQHGGSPHGTIIDELWAHKSDKLQTALTTASGAREQPLSLGISTAGYTLDSPLGGLWERALDLPDIERPRPFLTIVRDRANGFLMWWYGVTPADQGADLDDPAVWRACNPASWITDEYLRRQRSSPKMRLNDFRRFHLNAFLEVEDGWIEPADWDACQGEPAIPRGARAFVGVDIGRRKDSTAVVVAALVDGSLHVEAKIRTPEPERPVAVSEARADVAEFCARFNVEEVVYDPHQFTESAEMLAERGLPMVEFPQNDFRMAPASETLYELIRAGRLVHDGDELLRKHMLAAVPAETERGVRISKRRSKKQIDAAIALAMAAERALHAPPPKPKRSRRMVYH